MRITKKDQEEKLHSIIDCIIKGKLGNEKYEDFKCLMEKKKSNEKLTSEEEKNLKNYKDMYIFKSKSEVARYLNCSRPAIETMIKNKLVKQVSIWKATKYVIVLEFIKYLLE